jgi:hypothetical protein
MTRLVLYPIYAQYILNDSLLPIKIDSLHKSRMHICKTIFDKVMRNNIPNTLGKECNILNLC